MIVEDVATRVRTVGLTVFTHAVPNGVVPDRYVVVQGSPPRISSDVLADEQYVRIHGFWVRTFATDKGTGDEQVAVSRCVWAAEKADEALAGWRMNGWVPEQESTSPARRDRDQPDKIVAYAASIWAVRTA